MTYFPDPFLSQSTALIPYTLPADLSTQQRALMERMHDAYMKSSFRTQITDCRLLHPMTIRERILAGTYAHLTIGPGLPEPFNGTRKDLLEIIQKTVHATVDKLDYNGSRPYLKILDQLEKESNFGDVRIDSRNEEYGSTCVGMAHAILKELKVEHDVDGVLAVQRKSSAHPLEHGAAIVECSDGFVLLDARSDPDTRIFSIPFGGTEQYPGFRITAAYSGSTNPLILKCQDQEYEYCTNVGNGDDLVMKHFVMHATFDPGHEYFPIATYNDDGSDRKFIGVSLKDSIIFLKDRKAPKGIRAENISFKFIRDNPEAFRQKLQTFMEPKVSLGPIEDPNESFFGFRIPVEVAYQQLVRLASQENRIQRIFIETHPDAVF